jgi:mannose-6-phosphate isomerase-like protein (cupin superfamily)
MAVDTKATATIYNMRTPYLEQGRTTDVRARTEIMTVTAKVYAEGGENAMHHHVHEDHTFFVLEGEATFHIETDDNVQVVKKNEGVMLPRLVNYWFQSSGEDNLVMIRIGALHKGVPQQRLTPTGEDIPGDSEANKTSERIERPGKGYGE